MHLQSNSKICFTYIKKSQKAIDFISYFLLNDPSLQKEYDQINFHVEQTALVSLYVCQ